MIRGFRRLLAVAAGLLIAALAVHTSASSRVEGWNPKTAAGYLDQRQQFWSTWPNAARDHDTFCVSCHTAAPYALARPALRATLNETAPSATERALHDNVVKRVKLWSEVAPFYPDQTRGLPKTSESRGTEAVLNALVLTARDSAAGALSDDARVALTNMWNLQMRTGPLNGAWAWLNFHLEPWESDSGAYFGATLAALAVANAPGGYAVGPDAKDGLQRLRGYLAREFDQQNLFNKLMAAWVARRTEGLLTADQHRAIRSSALAVQQSDGGWTFSSLGTWKRTDDSPPSVESDGYATALVVLALRSGGGAQDSAALARGIAWLRQHQDPKTGQWRAWSLNKQRDPATPAAGFMSDAATAYAVLALVAEGAGELRR